MNASPWSLSPVWRWGLLVTMVASAWALWWPDDTRTAPLVPQASEVARRAMDGLPKAASAAASAASDAGAERRLTLAERDVFSTAVAAASPVRPTAQNVVPVMPAPAPVLSMPPELPPVPHRFLGRLRDPAGQWLIFLTDPGAPGGAAWVQRGTVLSTGWTVDSVGTRSLRLSQGEVRDPVEVALPPLESESP